MWACGVAAAARAAATAPGLRLFVLGALGGVAGVWEARESFFLAKELFYHFQYTHPSPLV